MEIRNIVVRGRYLGIRNDGMIRYSRSGTWNRGFLRGKEGKQYFCAFRKVYVHRLVGKYFVSNPAPRTFQIVDHIDGDEQNNHFGNLRWVNKQLNSMNRIKARNVYFDKRFRKWFARVTIGGVSKTLGFYKYFRTAFLIAQEYKKQRFEEVYRELIERENSGFTEVDKS